MIILFSKITGEIFGTIDGRVHDQEQIDKAMIKPEGVEESEVGRYVVSYKTLTRKVKQMQYKQMLNPDTLEVEQVEAGEIEVEEGAGLEMDDKFKEFFSKVEAGELSVYNHKFTVNEAGEVAGVVEKLIETIVPPTMPKKEVPQPTDSEARLIGQMQVMQKQIDVLTRMVKGNKK